MKRGDTTLIFLHIPKTAGTTLHHILERCYPKDQIFTFKDPIDQAAIEKFKRLAESRHEPYRLLKGHLSFGFHRHLAGPWTYFTFLREPIARVLSFYYYARSHPDHYLYSFLRRSDVDLKTLLRQRTPTTIELFNLQTRMIAGDEWQNPGLSADCVALERAKKNLRTHFQFVGLTEEFDASLKHLSAIFGWRSGSYSKKNVTRRKPPIEIIDTETRELLRAANVFDIELYQFGRELFDTQFQAQKSH
jgi:sulfotransferase famil protein